MSGVTTRVVVRDIELELLRRGTGRPLVLLHGFGTIDPSALFLDHLSPHVEIIAPSHPGFGSSPRPDGFETIYDLTQLYLELLETLRHERVTLVGFSFGGWIAAELAALCPHRIDRLILVDALGIKTTDRETPDILDVFNTHPAEVLRRRYHDPARFAPDHDTMTDAQLAIVARNWDSLALFGWQPYMYNPRLAYWLRRIRIPTLVLWGESDGIITPASGRAYANLIPGARFTPIPQAGHHPEIEQPDAFARALRDFLDT
jgi:pimeloyl-ACP methyl ester carboxylesterase